MFKHHFWWHSLLVCSGTIILTGNHPSLLIIDTQGKHPYYYRNCIMLAHQAGFKTEFKNIYDILETPDINQYDAIFFMVSPAMLQVNARKYSFSAHNPKKIIPDHCLQVLKRFCKQQHKAIGIILPGKITYSTFLQNYTHRMLYDVGQFYKLPSLVQATINACILHFTSPDNTIGTLFGTSLLPKNRTLPTLYNGPTSSENCCYTPINRTSYNADIQNIFPIGLIIKHEAQNNIYFISKVSSFDFADINEHLFKNPIDFSLRNELLQAAQETLHLFHDAYVQQSIPVCVQTKPLPDFLTTCYLQKKNLLLQKIVVKSLPLSTLR